MTESDGEHTESPATWENVAMGKAKEVLGHLTGRKDLEEEGEEQEEAAREVHDEYRHQHGHPDS